MNIEQWSKQLQHTYYGASPLIGVETYEEKWTLEELHNFFNRNKEQTGSNRRYSAYFIWSPTRAFYESSDKVMFEEGVFSPIAALEAIYKKFKERRQYGILGVIVGLGDDIKNPIVQRWLRDIFWMARASNNTLILVDPEISIPLSLQKEIVLMDFATPTFDDYKAIWRRFLEACGSKLQVKLDDNQIDQFLRSFAGFTTAEAEHIIGELNSSYGMTFDSRALSFISQKKKEYIRKSGLLEYIDYDGSLDDIGGLDKLKEYIEECANSYTEKARKWGIKPPKGVLQIGPPGTGKTLTALTTANILEMPLIKFDIGSLFGQFVGESEGRTRRTLKDLETYAPCVVLMDEFDKYISGLKGSTGDSGVGSRVLGYILTFMNDTKAPLFFMGTSNSINIPPELLRKGRWDEIFYTGLPAEEERKEIWKIHLRKVNRKPKDFDLDGLAEATKRYSGSEIEGVIQQGLRRAFSRSLDDLDDGTLQEIISETYPLAKTMSTEIKAIEEFAKHNAKSASSTRASKKKLKIGSKNDADLFGEEEDEE